jgi:ribosomal-protein-alanine N-acetyltransferase
MVEGKADLEVHFEPMLPEQLDAVVAIEQRAYAHPWNRTNFLDALQSGNQAQLLVAGDVLLGYFVAMPGVDEMHLLNITVAPEYQGQGWSRIMLDALTVWARSQSAQWLWLEVRVGNLRAMRVYEAHGYKRVGQRKDYYPSGHGQREDAVVMGLRL